MTIRLPIETSAGTFSESVTFLRLIEHLRLAAEDCYLIGHHRKENGDLATGQLFLVYGQSFEKACEAITATATRHARAN